MPSLDQYANVRRDDKHGISSWLLAHWFRHQTYAYAASVAGVETGPYDFRTFPDQDWFTRHSRSHQSLQQFMAPDNTIDLTVLGNYTWDNDQDYATWMQMHTLIHRRLDEGFGVF